MLLKIGMTLGIILGAYIIGSFPTGFLLVKIFAHKDIREVGSGSTGATNVKRVLGKKGFFAVMLIDIIKGWFPVFLTINFENQLNLFQDLHILPILVSIALIFGHSKSIFLGFTGGKSVATSAGTAFALNFPACLIAFIIWAIIAYVSRYISLASMIALGIFPFIMYLFGEPISYIIYCIFAAFYVIYLHRENIKRLMNGTENKVR
jgi:glycerol-3-phosphate acyltransferase PlsY